MKGLMGHIWVVAFAIAGGEAYAAAYGTAGCGLGSIVIGPKPGFMQVFAATTNGTGVQTFGITSGTSNCTDKPEAEGGEDGAAPAEGEEGTPKKEKKGKKKKKSASIIEQRDFVIANLSTLKREVAQGGGEAVSALAATIGCDDSVYNEFAANLQTDHGQIFSAEDGNAVLINVKASVDRSPTLAEGCNVGVY